MASVHPFRAFRYNPEHVSFGKVLTQPYDKINASMQERYYGSDSRNLIIVEKGREYPNDTPQHNVYTRADLALRQWIAQKVVVQDSASAFYAYTQEYHVPGTTLLRTRRGFIGLGKLEDYSAGVIFRHEHTFSGPKADRLELLRHTRTHTGQLFLLYSDPQQRIEAVLDEAEALSAPVTLMTDEYGVIHRLWLITEARLVSSIQKAMADQKLVIADGHHRYETSLNYRDECRRRTGRVVSNAPYEFSMMTFVNARSEGLTILPTHRVVANLRDFSWSAARRYLEPWFSTEVFSFAGPSQRYEVQEKFLLRLAARKGQRAIGVYPAATPSERAFYLLTWRPEADVHQFLPGLSPLQQQLDVVLLHQGILEPALGIPPHAAGSESNISYEREAPAAIELVDEGAQAAFLLNAVEVDLVMRIATAGEVMPQKSTDFYPKLLSGITMYRLEE